MANPCRRFLVTHLFLVFGNGPQRMMCSMVLAGAGVELAVPALLAFATPRALETGAASAFSQLSGACPHHWEGSGASPGALPPASLRSPWLLSQAGR